MCSRAKHSALYFNTTCSDFEHPMHLFRTIILVKRFKTGECFNVLIPLINIKATQVCLVCTLFIHEI